MLLKEVGFPLDKAKMAFSRAILPAPSLEELIEACKSKFQYLYKIAGGGWLVHGINDDTLVEVKGSTPTEAVARLWLALNPKQALQVKE